jgi:HlyD family secretion protein
MDIVRPDLAVTRRKRRIVFGGVAIAALSLIAFAALRVPASVPSVPRSSLWTAKVTRGPMLREVRGTGKLVPIDVRWITAQQTARVERVVVQGGMEVEPQSVLLLLSNPETVQAANDAAIALRAAEQELEMRIVSAESELLRQRAAAAAVAADADEAERLLRVQEKLAREGLSPTVTLEVAQTRARSLAERRKLEEARVTIAERAASAERNVARSRVDQLRALADLRARQQHELEVRAGIRGIVQLVPVQAGQQVNAGTVLAKVAVPDHLKAELAIPETLARDLTIGQSVMIDTRNGRVRGTIARIDPAAQNGTVTVDAALPAALPKGARPDLTVDGTVELERLANVLWVARPLQVDADSTASLFRIRGDLAERVPVRIGRASANAIEILGGLSAGDEVILSDMSAWSGRERVRIE